jgi:hypothetical protein
MAAFTLFDLTYRVARELGVVYEGIATGGSASTIIDTVYLLDSFEDDAFNTGTAWILHDAGGAGAAPQGEMGRVSNFIKATGVVSLAANLTVAVAAGDQYAISNREYTLYTIIQNINSVLGEFMIPHIDTTSIDTEENVTEYDLPADVLDQNIKVFIQRSTETDQNLWMEYYDWKVEETATGTAKKLIFNTQPPEPWGIKIKYWLPHPTLYDYSDELAENLNINRVVIEAALRCLSWKKAQKSQVDPVLDQRIMEFSNKAALFRSRFPNRMPEVKLATYGNIDNFGDE